ncbi:MAG: hypothetical protein ACK486_07670, partial [Cyanobacteriota bacterium]
WLFHRRSGASTAYIGSSNLSSAALLDGLEWNVRLAALETPAMLHKFQANFDAYCEVVWFFWTAPIVNLLGGVAPLKGAPICLVSIRLMCGVNLVDR